MMIPPFNLELETERQGVVLRELSTPKDDRDLFGLFEANRTHWGQHKPNIAGIYPTLRSIREARLHAALESELRLGIWDNAKLVGWLSLIDYGVNSDEGNWLGGWIDKDHVNQGYATTAARAVIEFVRNDPKRSNLITTLTFPDNAASIRVLEKLGFDQIEEEDMYEFPDELVYRLDTSAS